jgi:hypothetical protein
LGISQKYLALIVDIPGLGDATWSGGAHDGCQPLTEKRGQTGAMTGAVSMVSELKTFPTSTNSLLTPSWRLAIDGYVFRAFASTVRRVGHVMAGWVRIPVLPYATFWEASVVVSLITEPEFCKRER